MPSESKLEADTEVELEPESRSQVKYLGIPVEPIALLTFAACASVISQSTLSPVFGALPSAINHRPAVILTTSLAFILRYFTPSIRTRPLLPWIAVLAFWMPVLQFYLFHLSGTLGPQGGPALIGFLSCHGLLIPPVYIAAERLQSSTFLRIPHLQHLPLLSLALTGILSLTYLLTIETAFTSKLPHWRITRNELNPVQMQLALGAWYTALSHARYARVATLAPALPSALQFIALMHTAFLNPHTPTSLALRGLNRTLHSHGWSILDRKWSNTGYISVLENNQLQYRLLRCDHSLLGGEWQLTATRKLNENWVVNEPVYAVFSLLEAVRLIQLDPPTVPDNEAQALIIGLGIGTAPKAFINHGINTTILELDPVVHSYATKYFALPTNHTPILSDAVTWVAEASTNAEYRAHFSYIIHDVFTGGAEPLALFTETFLRNLRALLTADGAIALNYAGDVNAPLTKRVLNTVYDVFEGRCRIYRDAAPAPPPPSEASSASQATSSFTSEFSNLVVFCRNTPGPLTFRQPQREDFQGSKSRESHLLPNPELEILLPLVGIGGASAPFDVGILQEDEVGMWADQQARSALQHWRIMRDVVPDVVWELW